jgi:hypothetical protein
MTIVRKVLSQLPEVFHKNTLIKFTNNDEAWAKLALHRWVQSGDLKSAGMRSSIYYNLVVDPHWNKNIVKAIHMAYQSPVLVGGSVLHAHGWITQIPNRLQVVKPEGSTQISLTGVDTFDRPLSWYKENGPFSQEDNVYGMTALSPLKALKDAFKHKGQDNFWCPDLDDLYLPEDIEKPFNDFLQTLNKNTVENNSGNRIVKSKMKRTF